MTYCQLTDMHLMSTRARPSSKLQNVRSRVLDVRFWSDQDHSTWISNLNTVYVLKILYGHFFTIHKIKIMFFEKKNVLPFFGNYHILNTYILGITILVHLLDRLRFSGNLQYFYYFIRYFEINGRWEKTQSKICSSRVSAIVSSWVRKKSLWLDSTSWFDPLLPSVT